MNSLNKRVLDNNMAFTNLEKLAGLGTLVSIGIHQIGEAVDSNYLATTGIISIFSCATTFGVSYLKRIYKANKGIDVECNKLKQIECELDQLEEIKKLDPECAIEKEKLLKQRFLNCGRSYLKIINEI